MKRYIAKYLLYIYTNFIVDNDIDIYKNYAKPLIKILKFIRNIFIWFVSIIFFPIFVIGMEIEKLNKN